MSPFMQDRRNWFAPLWTAAAVLALSACGGGGSSSTPPPPVSQTPVCDPADASTVDECGTVLVSFTDEEGDFLSYVLDVESLVLEKANGATVETLPNSVRIDFAQYTELSEFVSAANIPPGTYVKGTIRVDYSNAEVNVEVGGEAVPATVVDSDGTPLTSAELDIVLDDRNHLVITRGRPSLLTVDFDLAASHTVDTSVDPVIATAEPFIVAEIDPVDEKDIRVRGALVSVDVAGSNYTVRLRPWHRRDGDHGEVTVNTTETTTFEIDGESFEGEAGLTELEAAGEGTPVVALGTLNVAEREFTADQVAAGSSVIGDGVDGLYGNVVARTGDELTVKGVTIVRGDGTTRFRGTVLVTVGPDTSVTKAGDPNAVLDASALSVGQRILVFGETNLSDDPSVTDIPTLDATQGRVRMLVTRLTGTVNSVLPGQLNMTLRGIDRKGIDMFNFAGTGMSAAMDADPLDYEVATGNLGLNDVITDTAVRVFGFVTPFGMAPPDFTGRTVVDYRAIRAALGIGWTTEGTSAPFMMADPDGLVLALDNPDIGERHHIKLGDRVIDLFDLPGSPPIVEPAEGRTLYSLVEPGHVELFREFDDFVAELNDRLGAGDKARSLAAYGSYDQATNTVTANKAVAHMIPNE